MRGYFARCAKYALPNRYSVGGLFFERLQRNTRFDMDKSTPTFNVLYDEWVDKFRVWSLELGLKLCH